MTDCSAPARAPASVSAGSSPRASRRGLRKPLPQVLGPVQQTESTTSRNLPTPRSHQLEGSGYGRTSREAVGEVHRIGAVPQQGFSTLQNQISAPLHFERLEIERVEPRLYHAADRMCRSETIRSEGAHGAARP